MFTVGIYKILNTTTGDLYIGSSQNVSKRKWEHRYKLDKNIHPNLSLQNAWNRYGGTNVFRFEVIEETTVKLLVEREQYYIDTLKPVYNAFRVASRTVNSIPVIKIGWNGELEEYDSINEAARRNGIDVGNLLKVLNRTPLKGRNRKITYATQLIGYKWEYKNKII